METLLGTNDIYLPGAASLLEQLDKRIIVILMDGRHLVGVLRRYLGFPSIRYCTLTVFLYLFLSLR